MDRFQDASSWAGPLVWYVFLAGTAAGSYVPLALAYLVGDDDDRHAARPAFLMVLVLSVTSIVILMIEPMGRHSAWERLATGGRHGLLGLAVAGLVGTFGALGEEGLVPGRLLGRLNASIPGKLIALGGLVSSIVIVTTGGPQRPSEWASQGCMTAVGLASAATTGLAAVSLIASNRVSALGDHSLVRLNTGSSAAIVAELACLTALALTLRGMSGLAFQRWPGRLIPLFVVPVGLVGPLLWRQGRGVRGAVDAAWLVLLGGFVLRATLAGIPASLTLR